MAPFGCLVLAWIEATWNQVTATPRSYCRGFAIEAIHSGGQHVSPAFECGGGVACVVEWRAIALSYRHRPRHAQGHLTQGRRPSSHAGSHHSTKPQTQSHTPPCMRVARRARRSLRSDGGSFVLLRRGRLRSSRGGGDGAEIGAGRGGRFAVSGVLEQAAHAHFAAFLTES